MSKEKLTTKRFVIRKSLIGKNVVITFTNKKGKKCTYNHDEVYYNNQERFDNMKCFEKYKSYTCTNNLPTFARKKVNSNSWLIKDYAKVESFNSPQI